MSRLLKFCAAVLVISTGILVYLYSQDFRPIVYRAAEQSVANIVASTSADADDFKLLFCGTGSPNRTPDRGQPCTALVADGKLFLFDAGEGAMAKLAEYGAPTGALHMIFLTHLHSDHISGVAEVLHNTWLYGRRHPVSVLGPPGTNQLLEGFKSSYSEDLHERMRVLGRENLDPSIVFNGATEVVVEGATSVQVYNDAGLSITAFPVDHPDWPHAYGYRVDYRGKTIVISGDTRGSANIAHHAKGADILIHEAVNTEIFDFVGEQMALQDGPMSPGRIKLITDVHTPTLELAAIAHDAGVDHLVITHLIPATPAIWIADLFFTSGMDAIYKGEISVARDGLWLDMNAP